MIPVVGMGRSRLDSFALLGLCGLTSCESAAPATGRDAGSATDVSAGDAQRPDDRPVGDHPVVDAGLAEDAVDADPGPPDAGVDAPDAGVGASDVGPDVRDAGDGRWRSVLYPADWTPAHTAADGRFLHDFSYAGYHNGAGALGTMVPARRVDVVADVTGARDATAAAQRAIGDVQAMGGGVVYFPEGLYRLDGVLEVTASNVVLRGAGPDRSRLFFTSSVGRAYGAHVRVRGAVTSDLELPLAVDGARRASVVEVGGADAGTLAVGDDVQLGWFITPEFIADHGMTGTWRAFNGQWAPFFHRHVVAIERTAAGARVTLDVPLRYPARVRDRASLRRVRGLLREVGVEHLGLANAVSWSEAWAQNQVHVLEFNGVEDGWVQDVRSFPSPSAPASGPGAGAHLQSSGMVVLRSKRITVADSEMALAENRGDNGNGYLWEVSQSGEVLYRDVVGRAGRHNFIQNWGFGATGCVWLRVRSTDGQAVLSSTVPFGLVGYSEYHHSLATANLVDSSTFDDGISNVNRGAESTGAGHTGTENVLWNAQGRGVLRSMQWGTGYVIGTRDLTVQVNPLIPVIGDGTAPIDHLEGEARGATLDPPSLYEDQLRRRLAD